MRPPAPPRAAPTPARAHTSRQIRRFSLIWLVSAISVLIAVAASSQVAAGYRAQADETARAATSAQLTAARLRAGIEREVTDHTAYDITGDPAYVGRFGRDAAQNARLLDRLEREAGIAASGSFDKGLLRRTLKAVSAWLDANDEAMVATAAKRRGGTLPQQGAPSVDRTADGLLSALQRIDHALPANAAAAVEGSRRMADRVDIVRQVALLSGLILLLAGGIRLVRQAGTLAEEAALHQQREERWRAQIEEVMAWSVRAKGAVTRSQLIGLANTVPREALGATCFLVAEGAAPTHPSHGQPRIALEVDDSGNGLHVSVCFADGRGHQHDHHALDLLLGHLAGLWRTVLRQEGLERAAGHDALTGLPNRRTFEAELRRRSALWRRRGLGFTLALADLDHFKLVNDTMGHSEGDTVLRRAGEAIHAALRQSDRVYRIGGEEFALLLETTDAGGVQELLERARQAVKGLGVEPTPGRRLSTSIGWAIYGQDADERTDLMNCADAALYEAKDRGRDRVVRTGETAAAA
jgi:diguanylate cyclase (GGDEF)-like protein